MPAVDQKDIARPEFTMQPVQNKAKSDAEGRPIFEDKEMVTIRVPGDRNLTVVREVTDSDRDRFPKQYAAFKRGEQTALEGTPLEMWPQVTRARVAELKAQSIFTVEEYADVTDGTLPKLGIGAREEREKARAFLDLAKGSASVESLAAENAELKERLARLEAQVGVPPSQEKDISDCSDDELKAFIKKETGEAVKGNPSRGTLLKRATEIANERKAA